MANNFDDTLIGREERGSNYRTWSERAVVIGFNDEEQAYDIVITTEKTLGNNVRSLNRTIRKVKAVVRPSIRTYLPGESIVVGYVDDRREHPVIVGLGDSSGHTCIKVTLGVTTTTPTIEGPAAPSVADPEFNVFFPLEMACFDPNVLGAASQTGLTCTVDCTASLPEIRFTAINGKPPYTWTLPLTAPAGCSFGGVGGPSLGPPIADSVNDSRLVVTAPLTVGLTVAAYENRTGTGACQIHGGDKSDCVGEPTGCSGFQCCEELTNGTFIQRDCNGDFISGSCASNLPRGPVAYIETSDAKARACAADQGWIVSSDFGGICQALRDRLAPTDNPDIRDSAAIAGGCCPCEMAFFNLIVTVSDAESIMVSQTVVTTFE